MPQPGETQGQNVPPMDALSRIRDNARPVESNVRAQSPEAADKLAAMLNEATLKDTAAEQNRIMKNVADAANAYYRSLPRERIETVADRAAVLTTMNQIFGRVAVLEFTDGSRTNLRVRNLVTPEAAPTLPEGVAKTVRYYQSLINNNFSGYRNIPAKQRAQVLAQIQRGINSAYQTQFSVTPLFRVEDAGGRPVLVCIDPRYPTQIPQIEPTLSADPNAPRVTCPVAPAAVRTTTGTPTTNQRNSPPQSPLLTGTWFANGNIYRPGMPPEPIRRVAPGAPALNPNAAPSQTRNTPTPDQQQKRQIDRLTGEIKQMEDRISKVQKTLEANRDPYLERILQADIIQLRGQLTGLQQRAEKLRKQQGNT